MSFVLMVEEIDGEYFPDLRCPEGGVDIEQQVAFQHLIPKGYAGIMEVEILRQLVSMHKWVLQVSHRPKAVMIRIHGSSMGFPYGNLSDPNKDFLVRAENKTFMATPHNMNYYKLANDMLVHVYNATEV